MQPAQRCSKRTTSPRDAAPLLLFARLRLRVDAGRALLVTGRNGSGKTTLLAHPRGADAARRPARRVERRRDAPHRSATARAHRVRRPSPGAEGRADGRGEPALAGRARRRADVRRRDCARRSPTSTLHAQRAAAGARAVAGQRRRVGARAPARCCRAPLWLLDEPATALDADGARAAAAMLVAQRLRERRHRDRGDAPAARPAAGAMRVDDARRWHERRSPQPCNRDRRGHRRRRARVALGARARPALALRSRAELARAAAVLRHRGQRSFRSPPRRSARCSQRSAPACCGWRAAGVAPVAAAALRRRLRRRHARADRAVAVPAAGAGRPARSLAHWLTTGLPLVAAGAAARPAIRARRRRAARSLALALLLGTPILSLLGAHRRGAHARRARRRQPARAARPAALRAGADLRRRRRRRACAPGFPRRRNLSLLGAGLLVALVGAPFAARRGRAHRARLSMNLASTASPRPPPSIPLAGRWRRGSAGSPRCSRIAGLWIGLRRRAHRRAAGRGVPHHLHPRAGGVDVDVHLPRDGVLERARARASTRGCRR